MNKLFLAIFIIPLTLFSQNIPFEGGAKSVGMGKSTLAISQV